MRRSACASAQSDQRLCYSPIGQYHIQTLAASNISISSLAGWFETHFVGNPEERCCYSVCTQLSTLEIFVSLWKHVSLEFLRCLAALQAWTLHLHMGICIDVIAWMASQLITQMNRTARAHTHTHTHTHIVLLSYYNAKRYNTVGTRLIFSLQCQFHFTLYNVFNSP